MWSRPDGCVYIAALSLAELIFLSTSRRATAVSLAKSAAVCAVVYGPWIVWAWWYYGSPIPHTIIAKGNVEQGVVNQLLATFDKLLTLLFSMAAQVFRPIYYGDTPEFWLPGMWGRVLSAFTEIVGIVALLYFLCPVKDRFGRAMSLCFEIVCFYFAYMPFQYPWYFPPAMIFGAIAFTRAAMALAAAGEGVTTYLRLRRPRTFVLATFVVLAAGVYPGCHTSVDNFFAGVDRKNPDLGVGWQTMPFTDDGSLVFYFEGACVGNAPGVLTVLPGDVCRTGLARGTDFPAEQGQAGGDQHRGERVKQSESGECDDSQFDNSLHVSTEVDAQPMTKR